MIFDLVVSHTCFGGITSIFAQPLPYDIIIVFTKQICEVIPMTDLKIKDIETLEAISLDELEQVVGGMPEGTQTIEVPDDEYLKFEDEGPGFGAQL